MVRYKMLGRDVNSSPLQFRTWVVDDEPDFAGVLYTGLKSGSDPLVNISATEIQDGYVIADFNLPNPLSWQNARQTLPTGLYNSQAAVVDGYVYLFGGKDSDVIYRATLDNPATWEDTLARLPDVLGGSQLALVDGYLYLFGGSNDSADTAVDVIYQASIDDPLVWWDSSATLPSPVCESQLGIADGYMYLFGGQNGGTALDSIFRANVSDPLTWIDTGDTLPQPLFGSQIGLLDGYFYLFGGLQEIGSPIDNIYQASLFDPTAFISVGNLPYSIAYGQFFTIGDNCYLVTPAAPDSGGLSPYLTRVLRCNRSIPSAWLDTELTVSADISQSQLAIIYDRIFLFGGNGSSVIAAADQLLKYPITDGSASQSYGYVTRTQYQSQSTPEDLIKVIGFPYWKTDYQP